MAGEGKKSLADRIEARNPKAGMALRFISNPDVVAQVVKGVRGSGFLKHRGVFSGLVELRAEQDPNKLGLIFDNGGAYPDDRLTYAQIAANSLRLARGLRERGLERGDKIAMVTRNHPEFIYALAACSMLGTVLVPIDPRARGEKLTYQMVDSDARMVITTGDLEPEVAGAARASDNPIEILICLKPGDDEALANKYHTINEILERREVFGIDDRADDPNLPVQIIYTSGVTGNPKGVTLNSARNAMYCLLGWLVWDYQKDDILYTGLSLAHGNAQAVNLFPALSMGIPCVIGQRFTKSRIWDVCRKHGCTSFSLLGGMMSGIYNEPERDDDDINPVRKVISAGTPQAIWEDFERRFGVKILEWYGAIEGGLAFKPVGKGPLGSFGKPLPGLVDMKVVDEDDNEVAPGVTGELISRMITGTSVEYYKKRDASEEKTRGGWLRSGDMVHSDEQGWLFFDYRKGGALRRAGDFIKPDLVEKVIGEHPDVSEVCVYGIPSSLGAPGESDLVAAVVPFQAGKLDPQSIFEAALKGLERNSVPSYIQVVDDIPKSASEKHLDRILRDAFDPEGDNVYQLKG